VEVEVRLDGQLTYKQNAEDLVAYALVAGIEAAGEDVAEVEEAFTQLVVSTAKVEYREAEGIDGGGRGERV